MVKNALEQYFGRFGFCPPQVSLAPAANLRLVIVVPCFDEPDLIGCLNSLWSCERPRGAVEVVVVINSSATAAPGVRDRNAQTRTQAMEWKRQHDEPSWTLQVLHFPDLPPKRAGVGLARKIGMDEALHRFHACGRMKNGIIVGYDADCRCDPNYLVSIERHFDRYPDTPGCSIYFEHPLEGPLAEGVYRAVTEYELHLRYYVQALRFARYPLAYHTVGSSMAVRASVYQEQGGMNKRAAGEDFYFLHKVIPLGGYTDLLDTAVRPSPRSSHRVPFGTGRAVSNTLSGQPLTGYPFEAFQDLKTFCQRIPELCSLPAGEYERFRDALPRTVSSFLNANDFEAAWLEMRNQTASCSSFTNRFFRWFDGFRAMKFVHSVRDQLQQPAEIAREAARLLEAVDLFSSKELSSGSLLEVYRRLDRECLNNKDAKTQRGGCFKPVGEPPTGR